MASGHGSTDFVTSSRSSQPTTIGSTRAGRISIAAPVALIAPIALVALVIAASADAPTGFRIGSLLFVGLPLSILCVYMIRSALAPDDMTVVVTEDLLEMHLGTNVLSYSRGNTELVLIKASSAGVLGIAPVAPGGEPRFLATGWTARRPTSVQRLLAARGWPSAISSLYFPGRLFHRVEPAPLPTRTRK